MNEPNAVRMIGDLTIAGHERSKIRRLAAYLDAIEQCIQAGFRHEVIHGWLVDAGIEIEYGYYRVALSRLRKAKNRSSEAKSTSAKATIFKPAFAGDRQTPANMITKPDEGRRTLEWDPLKPINPFEIENRNE